MQALLCPTVAISWQVCRDYRLFLLEKNHYMPIMEDMCTLCAIITCKATPITATPCLNNLQEQTRRPTHTILLSGTHLTPEDSQELCTKYASIGLIITNANDKAHESCGFYQAFEQLGADFVWVLNSDCTASPDALEKLLQAAKGDNISSCMITTSPDSFELSQPIIVENRKNIFAPWKSILKAENLPDSPRIPIRGAWIGALYPRSVFQRIGAPQKQFSLNNSNDEYAWKAKLQGVGFELIKDAIIHHPPFSAQLIHYCIGGRSFFYEPRLSPELRYYKIRNWAWIQRLRKPNKPFVRLAFCGFYIILALNAMLRCGELHLRDIYTLFRALHNGFYGKLRPYSSRKN